MTLPVLKWLPSPNVYPDRTVLHSRIIIHDCEGSYQGSIATFENNHSEVSAHFVLKEDGSEITQMVALSRIAWHVKAFNGSSLGIEMAGFAKAGYSEDEWNAVAAVLAWLLHKLNIPCQYAKDAYGHIGIGYCSHYDLGAAGGNHSDPTTNPVVWQQFEKRVQAAYAEPHDPSLWPSLKL